LVLSSAFHFLAMPWSNYFGRTCGNIASQGILQLFETNVSL
jgi:hypothetical protein